MKRLAYGSLRLSEKQRQCLEYVAQGDRPPFKITTVKSLARHGLVELVVGTGWRVTQAGVDWLAVHKEDETCK